VKNSERTNYIEEKKNNEDEKNNDESTFYACQAAVEKNDDVWFVDSGCSNHMTGDEIIFCNLDTTATTQITMGNGAIVKSKGKCTIVINSKKGKIFNSKKGKILIHDVLFVPELV
jgi:hypothetical protein